MAILDDFQQWLKSHGYKEYTPSGNPSTVYDYRKRIESVCDEEGISLTELIKKIDTIVLEYGPNGKKEYVGKKSHSAVINALCRFQEYLDDQK